MGWLSASVVLALVGPSLSAAHGSAAGQEATAVTLIYNHRPPLYVLDDSGRPGGVLGRAVRAAEEAGWALTLEERNSEEILRRIEDNKNRVCGVGWFDTSDRRQRGLMSRPIHYDPPFMVVARRSDHRITRHDSFAGLFKDPSLRLGRPAGYVYGSYIDAMIRGLGPADVPVKGGESRLAALLMDELVDYALVLPAEATLLLRNDRTGERLVARTLRDAPAGEPRHVYCSFQVGLPALRSLNEAIGRLHYDRPPQS